MRKNRWLAGACLLGICLMGCKAEGAIRPDTMIHVKMECEEGEGTVIPVVTSEGGTVGEVRIACEADQGSGIQIEKLELAVDGLHTYVAAEEIRDMWFFPELQGGDYDQDGQLEYVIVWFSGGTGGEYFSSLLDPREGELICVSDRVWSDCLDFQVMTTNAGETFVVTCPATGRKYEIPGPYEFYQQELEIPEDGVMLGGSSGITGIKTVVYEGRAVLQVQQRIDGAGGNVDDIGCVTSILGMTEHGFELLAQEIEPFY